MSRENHFIEELRAYTARIEAGEMIPGEVLARILKRLTELELEEGGPYALPERAPDLADNLVIACFLCACGVRLPKLDAFIEREHSRAGAGGIWYQRLLRLRALQPESHGAPPEAEARMLKLIGDHAAGRFDALPWDLAESARYLAARTIKGNSDRQMSLMAAYMREALGDAGEVFDDDYIARLGLANVFFWSSFIVYDDFWDEDEAAEPRLLPVANLFAREYADFFLSTLPDTGDFRQLFRGIMDKVDAANAWEIGRCRMKREGSVVFIPNELPSYGDFAVKFYPAAGHIFGPVAMLASLGYGVGSTDMAALIEYFKHYLIAMQINDDAHDWKEDLRRGHISTAVSVLLARWRARHPEALMIDVEGDMPELERLFWFEALEPLCMSVISHTGRSQDALGAVSAVVYPAPLEEFIIRNERVAREALDKRFASEEVIRIFA